ncbi:MAG TPA: DUF3237 domain-containing protein [Burkholderiaceae bacterium]|nr:DUF3237 domain-containing protein [Burkholderiaceae bacterium]
MSLAAPTLEPLCELLVEVGPALDVGELPQGRRRVVPITGGVVQGRLQGRVLAGGADFQRVYEGGRIAELDARYVLQLDDGSLVHVRNRALRVTDAENAARLLRGEAVDPAAVYFRCQPVLEASASAWRWLGERQFVGSGVREPARVRLAFFEVL